MRYLFLNPEEIIGTPQFEFIVDFLKSTNRTQIGWHYCIDLAWIYSQAKNWPTNFQILDAGGGKGPTQFLLAELGFNVTNIDLFLENPALRFEKRYKIEYKIADSYQKTSYVTHLTNNKLKGNILKIFKTTAGNSKLYQYISSKKYMQIHEEWRKTNRIQNNIGHLKWIQANLCNVPEIATNSFDAVVSLSALEHIPIELLSKAWTEITRICKPRAKVAITTSATEQEHTWFHHPSKGYCFSEQDLKTIFSTFPKDTNIPAAEAIERYRSCIYLKNNIARFYEKSGDNGMPWGKWDPQYIPVGLVQ